MRMFQPKKKPKSKIRKLGSRPEKLKVIRQARDKN